MRVCLIASQIAAWGKIGGFGSMTRMIGRELVKRGVHVFAVVPRRGEQKSVENLDGMTVLGYPIYAPFLDYKLLKLCNADIYHSQEPSFSTYQALRVMPDRKHVVTCIDPRSKEDWRVEYHHSSLPRKILYPFLYQYESGWLVRRAVQRVDRVFCQTRFIIPKAKSLYGLKKDPGFLPNPIVVPQSTPKKASKPTVCFLARLDRRKRPELFFELAKKFPSIRFIAIGKAHDKSWDDYLRHHYSNIPNLEMTGFIDPFKSNRIQSILEESWILVNTAAREGLPAAFLEALSYRCAILASVDPDEFSTRFGYFVKDDDFASGLEYLLEKDHWRGKGEEGYNYVLDTYEVSRVIDRHLSIYRDLLRK